MQYKWIALSVNTVGTLMAGIDARVIIVDLPTVARELGADVETIIWVSQSYSFDYNRHILFCLFESAAQHDPRCPGSVRGTGIYTWIQGRGIGVCNHQHLCHHSIVPARTGEGKTCKN